MIGISKIDQKTCKTCGQPFIAKKDFYYECTTCFDKHRWLDVPERERLRAALFDFKCAYCLGRVECWDHVIPLRETEPLYTYVVNGETYTGYVNAGMVSNAFYDNEYDITNLVPSCRRCNSSKNARDLIIWYLKKDYFSIGRLKRIIDNHSYPKQTWLDYLNTH